MQMRMEGFSRAAAKPAVKKTKIMIWVSLKVIRSSVGQFIVGGGILSRRNQNESLGTASVWMFKVVPGLVILAIFVVEIHVIDIRTSLGNENQLQVAITVCSRGQHD